MMNFEVRVVSANDFKAYLQQRIEGKTNAEALLGDQPGTARGDHPSVSTPAGANWPRPQVKDNQCISKRGCSSSSAAFFVLTTVAVRLLTALFATGGVEWAGTTAGSDRRPGVDRGHLFPVCGPPAGYPAEDYEGAEISDGGRGIGVLRPAQLWPIMVALSASVAAVGIALWLPWLITAGVVFVLASAAGLVLSTTSVPRSTDRPREGHNPGIS